MNSEQVFNALKFILVSNKKQNVNFNVVSADEIVNEIKVCKKYPLILIVNVLASNDHRMGHWVLLWFKTKDYIEIFDSFGLDLAKYDGKFFRFIKFKRKIQLDISPQNDDSLLCGQYVLWYIDQRLKKKSLNFIKQVFSNKNKKSNDDIVQKFYEGLRFRIIKKFKFNQSSCTKKHFLCNSIVYCQ